MKFNYKQISDRLKSPAAMATFVYLIITLVIFYPFVIHSTTLVSGTGGDSYQNLWDYWHIGYSLLNLKSIFSTKFLFWPVGSDLVTQTMSIFMGLITLPFQSVNLVFAYNIGLIIAFTFTGLAMFILAKYFVKNNYAAFFAGLIYAFSAFHYAQGLSHIDYINLGFIPLALYFLFRMIDNPNYKESAYFGITLLLLMLTEFVEQFIMFSLIALIILVWYALSKNYNYKILNKRFIYSLIAGVIIFFIIGSFIILPIISYINSESSSNAYSLDNIAHNELWSDNLLEFFVPSYYNGLVNLSGKYFPSLYYFDETEHSAYIGYTVIFLSLFAIYKYRRKLYLWTFIAIIFGLLCLGPYMQIGTHITNPSLPVPGLTGIPSLFLIYHYIPLINIIREPDRFFIIFSIALAILSAYGISALLEKDYFKNRNTKLIGIAFISILFLIGSTGLPITNNYLNIISTPIHKYAFYSDLRNYTGNFSVLILPILTNSFSSVPAEYPGLATYESAIMQKPIIGGYVTRENKTQTDSVDSLPLAVMAQDLEETGNFSYVSPIVENYTNQTLLTLYNYRTEFVTVNKAAYNSTDLLFIEKYLYNLFGSKELVYNGNTTVAFYTLDKLNTSIYRSYVSYPVLDNWEDFFGKVNDINTTLWDPVLNGEVIIYAPYKNITNTENEIDSKVPSYINSTISINAISNVKGDAPLNVRILNQNGNIVYNDTFNVTDTENIYTLNASLVSGPYGNIMLVSEGKTASGEPTVGIVNMSVN